MNCCGKFSLNFLYLFYYKIKDIPSKYIDGVFEIDTKIDTISLCCLGNPTYCLICVHENKKNIRGKKYPISPEKHLRASKNHEGQNDIRYQIRQCGLRRENTRLRKSSFLRTNHIGLSIRPLYLRVRARTVLDKKKKG